MSKKFRVLILAGLAAFMIAGLASVLAAQDQPLIPRQILFGNPVKASPRISPCGTRLAYLAPSDKGVLNVWVRTIGKDDDVQVTNDTHRGIRIHFWAEDGKHLFYLQDLGGDENFHVYSVDIESKVVRDLTPFQGVRASNMMLDKKFPNQMLVGLEPARPPRLRHVPRRPDQRRHHPRHRKSRGRAGLGHRPRVPDPCLPGAKSHGRLDHPARA